MAYTLGSNTLVPNLSEDCEMTRKNFIEYHDSYIIEDQTPFHVDEFRSNDHRPLDPLVP